MVGKKALASFFSLMAIMALCCEVGRWAREGLARHSSTNPFLLLGLGEEGLLLWVMKLAKHAPFPAKPDNLVNL